MPNYSWLLSIAIALIPNSILAADYTQNSTCGVVNPAFIETFSTVHPGGKGGDLDEARWSVNRFTGENFGEQIIASYLPADIPPCKQGTPATAFPDSELFICDGTVPAKQGRFMIPMAGQNYGTTSFRANQPFDFAGRTGTIAFDADAWGSGTLNHWVGLAITDVPVPGPLFLAEHYGVPPNGIVLCFANCGAGSNPQVPIGYVYHDYQETPFSTTQCYSSAEGLMNHIEVKLSQNRIEIWASDGSADGTTFPNFKMIASLDNIALPFTRGYVTLSAHNHATLKYSHYRTAPHYWDNIAFDGPVIPTTRVYSVPDALTPTTNTSGASVNIGYALHDSTANRPRAMLSCCGAGTGVVPPIALNNVDLTNAKRALISFNAFYPFDPVGVNFTYRFNNNPWRKNGLTAGELTTKRDPYSIGGLPHIIADVPLSDLKQGNNTFEFASADVPPTASSVLAANIDVSIEVSDGATAASLRQVFRSSKVALRTCYANRSTALLSFILPGRERVQLDIYDLSGNIIRTLAQGTLAKAGETTMLWDGCDARGLSRATGAYLAVLKAGNQMLTTKIALRR